MKTRGPLMTVAGVVAAGLAAAGIAWVVTRGDGTILVDPGLDNSGDSGLVGDPTVRPTEVPSTLTPEPTATPVQKGYATNAEGGFIFRTEKGEVLNVPSIPGLRAELVNTDTGKEVHYKSLAENPYGIQEGEDAGEYRPNVKVSSVERGGVVLDSRVVKTIMDDKIATIPEQKDKWMIALPVDISSATDDQYINLKFGKGFSNFDVAIIDFAGILPMTNMIPITPDTVVVAQNFYHGQAYFSGARLLGLPIDRIVPGRELEYFIVGGKFENTPNREYKLQFGDNIGDSHGPLYITLAPVRTAYPVTPEKILSVGENSTPVFLQSN